MNNEIWPELGFGQQEHPPSTKWNSILKIIEQNRKEFGPFSISKLAATGDGWQPTATSYYFQLDDDPWAIGGVDTGVDPPLTIKHFVVNYWNNVESLESGYARWDGLTFASGTIEGSERWWTIITSSDTVWGTVGSGNTLLSGSDVNISSFTCFKYSGGV